MGAVAGADVRADPAVEEAMRELAEELKGSVGALAGEMAQRIAAALPELGAEDEQVLEETRESCAANIEAVCAMLYRDVPVESAQPPVQALEYARSLARRGVQLALLLHAYRLGHAFFWERWAGLLAERLRDTASLAAAMEGSSAFMFGYVDAVCDRLVHEYGAERERWVRSAAAARAETARLLIDGESLDSDVASRRLGYELRRHHVGLVLWVDSLGDCGDALRSMEAAAAAVARRAGCGEPLLIPTGTSELWAWVGRYEPFDGALTRLTSLDGPALDNGVRAAIGTPAHGLDGFRDSHREALQAQRLARLAGAEPGSISRYEQVALASLLFADADRALRFARAELGALLDEGAQMERLRTTLRVFFEVGESPTRAARRLGVHQNTVTYRVRAAEQLLGRPVGERRLELETALLVAETLA